MNEEWRPVVGWEEGYEVSDHGRVRRLWKKGNHILSMNQGEKIKYIRIGLHKGNRRTSASVHRLVAEAFHGPCPDGFECAHLNGNKRDNRAENLQWVSRQENHQHKWLHGTQPVGERCLFHRFKEAQIYAMRIMYAMGAKKSEIAAVFGESVEVVYLAIAKGWKHLGDPIDALVTKCAGLTAEVERLSVERDDYRDRLNDADLLDEDDWNKREGG